MLKSKYFGIDELVSKQVHQKYGDVAWMFFDPRLIAVIDWMRETIDRPITCNNWKWGGNFQQRGFRANLDQIVRDKTLQGRLYCSSHNNGQGIDFDVKGMTAEQVRQWLKDNKADIPFNIRVEDDVSWVHIDVRNTGQKLYFFKP